MIISALCSSAYIDIYLLQMMFIVVKLILLLRISNYFSLSFVKYLSSADIIVGKPLKVQPSCS